MEDETNPEKRKLSETEDTNNTSKTEVANTPSTPPPKKMKLSPVANTENHPQTPQNRALMDNMKQMGLSPPSQKVGSLPQLTAQQLNQMMAIHTFILMQHMSQQMQQRKQPVAISPNKNISAKNLPNVHTPLPFSPSSTELKSPATKKKEGASKMIKNRFNELKKLAKTLTRRIKLSLENEGEEDASKEQEELCSNFIKDIIPRLREMLEPPKNPQEDFRWDTAYDANLEVLNVLWEGLKALRRLPVNGSIDDFLDAPVAESNDSYNCKQYSTLLWRIRLKVFDKAAKDSYNREKLKNLLKEAIQEDENEEMRKLLDEKNDHPFITEIFSTFKRSRKIPKDKLTKMVVTELKQLCSKYGLKTSGNKQILIDRISEYYEKNNIV